MDAARKNRIFSLSLEKGDQTAEDFNIALGLMKKYDSIERTRLDAMKWAKIAQEALDDVPDHSIKTILFDLADYVVQRVK